MATVSPPSAPLPSSRSPLLRPPFDAPHAGPHHCTAILRPTVTCSAQPGASARGGGRRVARPVELDGGPRVAARRRGGSRRLGVVGQERAMERARPRGRRALARSAREAEDLVEGRRRAVCSAAQCSQRTLARDVVTDELLDAACARSVACLAAAALRLEPHGLISRSRSAQRQRSSSHTVRTATDVPSLHAHRSRRVSPT